MSESTQVVRRDEAPAVAQEHEMEPEAGGALLRLAIDRGVSIEILERLVALQERLTERAAAAAFLEALTAFQASCPPVAKTSRVKYTTKQGARVNYAFAPLDEIARTVRPALAQHGLSYSWDSDINSGEVVVVCTLHHIAGHQRQATFRCPVEGAGSPTMNAAQKAGSAITYGERYSLLQVLGLSTESDTDGSDADVAGSAETISESQAADLDALIDDAGADRKRFLRFLKVESLGDVRVSQLPDAIRALEAKRGRSAA